jgi:hypothetical protein
MKGLIKDVVAVLMSETRILFASMNGQCSRSSSAGAIIC